MPTDKGVLLDTSVVIAHFRGATALTSQFPAFQELYLPQAALAELYAGAYRSARPEKNLLQIERFLEAVDVSLPDEFHPEALWAYLCATGASRNPHSAE